jgi:hypothetical protein
MQWVTWLNDLIHDAMAWAVMVALAFGATFAVWILDACIQITGRVSRHPFAGLFLFLFVMIGLPVLAVTWGYATGQLPAK